MHLWCRPSCPNIVTHMPHFPCVTCRSAIWEKSYQSYCHINKTIPKKEKISTSPHPSPSDTPLKPLFLLLTDSFPLPFLLSMHETLFPSQSSMIRPCPAPVRSEGARGQKGMEKHCEMPLLLTTRFLVMLSAHCWLVGLHGCGRAIQRVIVQKSWLGKRWRGCLGIR